MERKWWTLLVVCVGDVHAAARHHDRERRAAEDRPDLKASFSDIQWVIDAYALTLASVLLTAGALADLLGRRLVFSIGLRPVRVHLAAVRAVARARCS